MEIHVHFFDRQFIINEIIHFGNYFSIHFCDTQHIVEIEMMVLFDILVLQTENHDRWQLIKT